MYSLTKCFETHEIFCIVYIWNTINDKVDLIIRYLAIVIKLTNFAWPSIIYQYNYIQSMIMILSSQLMVCVIFFLQHEKININLQFDDDELVLIDVTHGSILVHWSISLFNGMFLFIFKCCDVQFNNIF